MSDKALTKDEIVFKKFTSIYGAQKVAAMWAGANMKDVRSDWARQIERFNGPTIGAALQALVDSGDDWPPTMAKFVATCRQFTRPEGSPSARVLAAPGQTFTSVEAAQANIVKVREMLAGSIKRIGAA